jgi:hypothetical protein
LLVCAFPLAFVAFVRKRGHAQSVQGAVGLAGIIAAYFALSAGTPTVWPLVIVGCVLPLLPLPGRPRLEPALAYSVVLIATTALTHAVFFGEDRYHVVTSPALCLLAAAVFRRPASREATAR